MITAPTKAISINIGSGGQRRVAGIALRSQTGSSGEINSIQICWPPP